MFTETVKVVSVDKMRVDVEVLAPATCSGCSARSACGQRLLSKLHPGRENFLRIPNAFEGLKPGDAVQLSVNESVLLRLSFLFYMLPLLSLLILVLLADFLQVGELFSIAFAVVGLTVGFVGLKVFNRANKSNPKFQPMLCKSEASL